MSVHLAVEAVVDVSGPDAGEEQQHLERQEMRRDVHQRPAVRNGLRR